MYGPKHGKAPVDHSSILEVLKRKELLQELPLLVEPELMAFLVALLQSEHRNAFYSSFDFQGLWCDYQQFELKVDIFQALSFSIREEKLYVATQEELNRRNEIVRDDFGRYKTFDFVILLVDLMDDLHHKQRT